MARHTIDIAQESPTTFRVTVSDARGASSYLVTVMPSDVEHYAPGWTPEELLEASFHFLLEREPREAILAQFDLPVIERYFPEYGRVMRGHD